MGNIRISQTVKWKILEIQRLWLVYQKTQEERSTPILRQSGALVLGQTERSTGPGARAHS